MTKKTGIWRFAGPLRIAALLTAGIYSLYYTYIWTFAWLGDTEDAYDFIDVISTDPLAPFQIIGGMFLSGTAIGAMVVIAYTSNKFLKGAYRDGFFDEVVTKTIKHIGYGLLLMWFGFTTTENIMPWLLTLRLEPELQEPLEWFPLDANIIFMIVGFVLILLSGAMDEAREIDADNKQFI